MADLPVDVTTLDLTTVKAIQAACENEITRQNILTGMPNQAGSCAYQYKAAGGNPQDIADAVQAWVDDHQGDAK